MASTDFLWMAQIFTLVALVGTAVLTVVITKWLMNDIRDINERIAEIEKNTYLRREATEKFFQAIERREKK